MLANVTLRISSANTYVPLPCRDPIPVLSGFKVTENYEMYASQGKGVPV